MIGQTAPSGASNLLNLNGDTVNVGVVGTSAGASVRITYVAYGD